MDLYQKYIALSRYSRFRPDLKRRETWEETVDRLMAFWTKQLGSALDRETLDEVRSAILNLEVMPSMRTLMAAGPALERDHMAAYNCSATTIASPVIEIWNDQIKESGHEKPIKVSLGSPVVFDNILYTLLCGTGVGFSVERQFVNTLPAIGEPMSRAIYQPNEKNYPKVPEHELSTIDNNTIRVADSKYGWASALRILIVELYNGNFDIQYDVSKVRKAGTPLKTFGGRASGPEPLCEVFEFVRDLFKQASGRKLTSIECHDIVCKIAASVVVGGVRRSALISLSNLSDDRMRHAKSGAWWESNAQRALANNSVCYTEKPDIGVFMREWEALYESKSGERGIFNRDAAYKKCESVGRDPNHDWLTNPCSEIILRPNQTCNLSEVVVRQSDDLESLKRKVRIAAIIGTWQSTLTNFAYLIPNWKENCDEERLLGVSLTGLMDHPVLAYVSDDTKSWLNEMRDYARQTNAEWAKKLNINPSAAITCTKPSGTVSQLVDSASGLHPRYAQYYIRRVRADGKDPLAKAMQEAGFPCEQDVMQPSNLVFSFPVKAPKNAVMRDDRTAIEQLEYWKMIQDEWCEHKPSVTIYVREYEWLEVGAWVYKHFDSVSGVSFLPHSDHSYMQAPYEECTWEQYETLKLQIPSEIPMSRLAELETSDMTTATQELSCTGGMCELA